MRIEQAHISTYSHLTKEFLSRWNLREYDNQEEPAFFWGLQWDTVKNQKDRSRKGRRKSVDIDLYVKHKGFKILHFVGAEFYNGLLHLVDKKNAKVLCTDVSEAWLCKKLQMSHKHLKIPYFDLDFHKSTKLGDKIYSHVADGEKFPVGLAPNLEYKKLSNLFGRENFCFPDKWKTINELLNFFNQSYCNIKPHPIRGNVSAWRLGLMGRKTIQHENKRFADQGPHYIYYKDDKELVKLVEQESKKVGTLQEELAKKVKECYHESDDWLYEEYWL